MLRQTLRPISALAALLVLTTALSLSQTTPAGQSTGKTAPAPVAPAASDRPLIGVHWQLRELDGKQLATPKGQRPAFVLTSDGDRITGSGGCNRLMGAYQTDGSTLRFKGVATTMMACADPVMSQERKFLAALNSTASYRISGKILELLNAQGEVVARLHAVTEKR